MKMRRESAQRGSCLTLSKSRISEIEAATSRYAPQVVSDWRNQTRSLTRNDRRVIQTGRDDLRETRPAAGHWALEPGCPGREFDDWERRVWFAGDGGRTAREAKRTGSADRGRSDRRDHDVLRGSCFSVFRSR